MKRETLGRRGTKFSAKAEDDPSNLLYFNCSLKLGSKMYLKVEILWSNMIGIYIFFPKSFKYFL